MASERGGGKMKEEGLGKTFKVTGHKNIRTQHLVIFSLGETQPEFAWQ